MTQSENNYAGDWLKWEEDNHYSREEITILGTGYSAGDQIISGTVLGKITATGKYVPHDPDGGDGSENAAGILLLTVTEGEDDADMAAVAIVRDAIVNPEGLTWSADTDLDQDSEVAALKNLGIIVGEGA